VGGTTAVAVGSGTGVSSGNGVEVGAVVGVGASVGTSVGAVANVGVGVGGGESSGVAVGSSTTTDPGSEVGIWVGSDGVGSGVGVAATATPCHRRRNQMRRLPLESRLLSTGLQRPGNCPLSEYGQSGFILYGLAENPSGFDHSIFADGYLFQTRRPPEFALGLESDGY